MPSTDRATPSPRSKLSKLRRNLGESNDSNNSLAESSNSDDPNADLSRRSSATGGVGAKLKDRLRRRSVDDRRDSNDAGRRLSKLVPGRKNKLKTTDSTDLERNLSVDSGILEPGNGDLTLTNNQSDSSIGLAGSGRSSLLTDGESEHEGKPVRPKLSPHQSHIGYLTLSSPELNSQTQPVAAGIDVASSSEGAPVTGSNPNIPQIVKPSNSEPFPPPQLPERNISPVEKFKGAFSFPQKKVGVDAESVKSVGSGQGGLGGLFRPSSRSNSVVAENVVDPTKSQEQLSSEPEKTDILPASDEVPKDNSQERPETPKQRGRPRINTGSLPQTPLNLTETPTTFVTPPTPTDPSAEFPRKSGKKASPARKQSDTLSSVDSIKHRRSQSAIVPSKLSQAIPAPPLSPTFEETKTPGGTLAHPAPATSFFSSVFSAAQKAADSFGNINFAPNQKNKPLTPKLLTEQGGEEVIPGAESQLQLEGSEGELKQRAIETLGRGDLSFSHLGISDDPSPMSSTTELPLQNGTAKRDEANKKAEEEAAARAVSNAYEKPVAAIVSQATGGGRPLSVASTDRLTLTGEQTPPRSGTDAETIKRSGSVRSRLSERRRRRHRGSSATTGTANTVAAGLAATTNGLQNLTVNGAGHRLTGFAVASNKRNKDFHQLFRSVPEDDYLIEDYSAALQRDILLHGRLYVSEGHICFSSNILGWVTNLVISFDEVVSVEKKSTAVIFPNAIVIQTLHARSTFASFVARDSTYELLIGIWKISHPNLKSSLNGVTLDDAGTGDKTEVAEPEGSEASSGTGSEDEVYDEDDDEDEGSLDDAGVASSIAGSDIGDRTLSRKTSAALVTSSAAQSNGAVPKGLEAADAVVTGAAVSAEFPGPATHAPTQCTDGAEHYDRPLIDITIPAPLGKIYSMTFGPASGAFMRKWLIEDQKSRDLNLEDSKTGLDNDHKTMTFDYIKPLGGSIGPKQTKCITTNTLISFDLEKSVTVDCGTQTPDVPSGNVFTTRTRYCFMWGPSNSTRMVANCTIEWTGKSWLKGPIEKGANDGQIEYVKALVAALNAAVTTKPPVKGVARKGKRKGKKEVFDAEEANVQRAVDVAKEQQASNWGPLEPVHKALSPFITSQVIIAVLTTLLFFTWINPPRRGGMSVGFPGYTSPERLAAYEEIWRREESSLWDWLEDRVGLDGIYVPSGDSQQKDRQKVLAARNIGRKLNDERMSGRQMDDAIRVTEERLSALKEAVARKKSNKSSP